MAVYDSDQVSVLIAGLPIDVGSGGEGGYADDEFLTIEQEADAFLDVVGVDGEVTRSKSHDGRATVTLRLMQSSRSNERLAALHVADKNLPNGAGIGAFQVKDLGGSSLYGAEECWIAKAPTASFGREAGPREWKIRVAKLKDFTGGN
jgi:hypothetical protein